MPEQFQPLENKNAGLQQKPQQKPPQKAKAPDLKEQFLQMKDKQEKLADHLAEHAFHDTHQEDTAPAGAHPGIPKAIKAKKKMAYGAGVTARNDRSMWHDYYINANSGANSQSSPKYSQRQTTVEQEMENIFATTEPMMEISSRIMEMKANDGIGQKLGRATARYCDRMMEYFEDEGFSREESMQLLCSMIRNNSVITGG